MEPAQAKITMQLAECQVIQVKGAAVTIDLGQGVLVTIHTVGFQHGVKEGDKIPLYTEMPRARTVQAPKL